MAPKKRLVCLNRLQASQLLPVSVAIPPPRTQPSPTLNVLLYEVFDDIKEYFK